jgi:mannose-1-phosphate guanylyltransferase
VGNRRDIWVVLLAAGDGQHLRALTANARLDGGRSPLQISMQRALAVTSRERIVIVVTEAHRRWWERELFALPRSQIVVQPSNRGTGLGFLLPAPGAVFGRAALSQAASRNSLRFIRATRAK